MSGEKRPLRNFTDGQFFDLVKRLLEDKYYQSDGIPALMSHQLIRPRKVAIVKSAGARWTRFYINRAVYLFSADGRRVDYINGEHPGDLSAASPSPWNSSVTGVCKLFTAGEWHVKTPLITGDVEAQMHPFIMTDAANGVGMDVSASEIAGAVAAGELVNVYKIGGTLQSGVDVAKTFGHKTASTQSGNADVDAASEQLIAANANRRGLYIGNPSETATLWYKFGDSPANDAVVGEGYFIPPLSAHSYDDTVPTGAVQIRSTEANCVVPFVEET